MTRFHPFALAALSLVATVFGTAAAAHDGASGEAGGAWAPTSSMAVRHLDATNLDSVGSPIFGPNAPFNATLRGKVQFGSSVHLAASGNTVAVSAPLYDSTESTVADYSSNTINLDGGAIFVYELNELNEWDTNNPLFFLAGEAGEQLGEFSMNDEGSLIAIRRQRDSVQVFDVPSGGTQIGSTLFCSDAANIDTVCMNDDGNGVALHCSSSTGRVEMFALSDDGEWVTVGGIDGTENSDFFGFTIAFSGTALAVSSPNHDANGSDSGMVQVFDYSPIGDTWSQRGNDILGGSPLDQLGFALALSKDGTTLVVSSPSSSSADDSVDNVGKVAVYSFDLPSNVWNQVGSEVYGYDANDKLGRAVSICPDATCFSATSWAHNQARGQALLFSYDSDAGEWAEVASVNGENRGDRLGHGRNSVSVSSAGAGIGLAVGSTWTNNPDISGNNAEKSVGQIQVFVFGENEVVLSSDSPSDTPTGGPSSSPTSSSATLAPTSSPTSSPTTSPTLAPSEDTQIQVASPPPTTLGSLDWDLERSGDILVQFRENSPNSEISFDYSAHKRAAELKVYHEDCETRVGPDVIFPTLSSVSSSQTHNQLTVTLDVNQANLESSPIFTAIDEETGLLSLCTRVDLLADDDLNSPVVFHEQIILVTLNLANSFSVTSIGLNRTDADTYVAEVDLEYGVTACHCDDAFDCFEEAENVVVTQNSIVNICVRATSDIVISDIRQLELTQGGLTQTSIYNGTADKFTAVWVNPNGVTQLAVIQTFLLSGFFGKNPEDVSVRGSCSLSFTDDSGARSLRAFDRKLHESHTQEEEESAFAVRLAITDSEQSSATATRGLAILVGVLSGLVAFIM